MKETAKPTVEGFLKIFDPATNEIFFEGSNAIHFENMSESLAQSLSNNI